MAKGSIQTSTSLAASIADLAREYNLQGGIREEQATRDGYAPVTAWAEALDLSWTRTQSILRRWIHDGVVERVPVLTIKPSTRRPYWYRKAT